MNRLVTFTSNEEDDDYQELQVAFEKGLLKPGLHKEVQEREYLHINNVTGLKRKQEEIKLDVPWTEELVVTCEPAPIAPELALELETHKKTSLDGDLMYDDFAREIMFYRLGQTAVLEGIQKLHKLNILTKRPNDYLAEMAKSDDHMHKVRKKLKHKENVMFRKEQVRNLREVKKRGKKVQIEKQIQKQEERNNILEQLRKYRKGKANSLDFLDEEVEKPDTGGMIKSKRRLKKEMNDRSKDKARKYGVHPMRGRWKQNTAEDLDGPLNSVGQKKKRTFKGMPKKKTNKRLGKNLRQKMKHARSKGKRNKR